MYASNPQVWLAFGLYLLITFGLAHLAHRRSRGTSFLEDFFVAGREIGPWVLALTWTATMASGGTFIGTPALAHTYGWPVMLWICSYMVVATIGMGLLGKRVADIGRRTGALTFPDLLRDRFESHDDRHRLGCCGADPLHGLPGGAIHRGGAGHRGGSRRALSVGRAGVRGDRQPLHRVWRIPGRSLDRQLSSDRDAARRSGHRVLCRPQGGRARSDLRKPSGAVAGDVEPAGA